MNDYPDNELINMVSEKNEDASDILYKKYNFIVSSILKKYSTKAHILGIDYAELKQEALVGFSDALVNFDQEKDASLNTFITLCVDRRVSNYVRKMESNKERMNKDNISLDMEIDEYNHSLHEVIGSSNMDPASIVENDEVIINFMKQASSLLSESENKVLELLLDEYNYEDIAKILNIPIKSVYNKIARIRAKLK